MCKKLNIYFVKFFRFKIMVKFNEKLIKLIIYVIYSKLIMQKYFEFTIFTFIIKFGRHYIIFSQL